MKGGARFGSMKGRNASGRKKGKGNPLAGAGLIPSREKTMEK